MSTTIEILGLREIADRLGITYQAARLRRSRGDLPAPDWVVSGSPVWSAETIAAWETEKTDRG